MPLHIIATYHADILGNATSVDFIAAARDANGHVELYACDRKGKIISEHPLDPSSALDFDGDREPDLAVFNADQKVLQITPGNSIRELWFHIREKDIYLDPQDKAVLREDAFADINGDGKLDVMCSYSQELKPSPAMDAEALLGMDLNWLKVYELFSKYNIT